MGKVVKVYLSLRLKSQIQALGAVGAVPAAREADALPDRLAHAALGRDRAGEPAPLDPRRTHQARPHRLHLQPAHHHQE